MEIFKSVCLPFPATDFTLYGITQALYELWIYIPGKYLQSYHRIIRSLKLDPYTIWAHIIHVWSFCAFVHASIPSVPSNGVSWETPACGWGQFVPSISKGWFASEYKMCQRIIAKWWQGTWCDKADQLMLCMSGQWLVTGVTSGEGQTEREETEIPQIYAHYWCIQQVGLSQVGMARSRAGSSEKFGNMSVPTQAEPIINSSFQSLPNCGLLTSN